MYNTLCHINNLLYKTINRLRYYIPCRRQYQYVQQQYYSTMINNENNLANTADSTQHDTTTNNNNNNNTQTTTTVIPWVIIGLGNGSDYINTRHNAGQDSIEYIVNKISNNKVSLLKHNKQYICKIPPTNVNDIQYNNMIYKHNKCYYIVYKYNNNIPLYIAITNTYMNNSGHAVKSLLTYIASLYNIQLHALLSQFICMYDELDLSLCTLRYSNKSQSRTTHNGIYDVQKSLQMYNNNNNNKFIRLRIGIKDNDFNNDNTVLTDYVLDTFDTYTQQHIVNNTKQYIYDSILYCVNNGIDKTMNVYNKTYHQLCDINNNNISNDDIKQQRLRKRMKYEQTKSEKQTSTQQQQHETRAQQISGQPNCNPINSNHIT